jgi:hypothetical protein
MSGSPSGWNHYAFVKDETAGNIQIYLNGELAASDEVVDNTLIGVRNKPFKIGSRTRDAADFRGGRMDDFMIYNRALTDKEIARQYQSGGPVGVLALAWGADPRHGETDVYRETTLAWSPGDYAVEHDVYLGTDWDDVNDATTSSTGIYRGRQDPCEYTPPSDLEFNTTYYWRIDEVNDPCVWKGPVWAFTVGNFIVIDDFESYDDMGNEIFYTWVEDDFSAYQDLGVEGFEPVRGGSQSLWLVYNNAIIGPDKYYSEVGKALGGMDFTQEGVKALTLYFYGDPTNVAGSTEEPYIGLDDGSNYAESRYTDTGNPISDIQEAEWHEWNIAVSDFNTVTTTSIETIFIGLGIRGNTVPGGGGQVYFDDVRLYLPKCIAEIGPEYDFSGNCIVDLADVGVIVNEWLRTDAQLSVQAPAQPPVAHWELDDVGAVATDSEGSNNGSLEGDYKWVSGRVGSGAVEFTDDGGRVRVPHSAELMPNTTVSATAWIYANEKPSYSARIVTKGIDADNWEAYFMQFNGSASWAIRDLSHSSHDVESDELNLDEWFHIAGTYDGDSVKLYINGQLDQEDSTGGSDILQDDSNDLSIGNATDINDRAFLGRIDDVRIYDYALNALEVAYVATAPAYDGYVALTAKSNVYDEESVGEKVVNFRDLAEFMTAWMEEKLWPE